MSKFLEKKENLEDLGCAKMKGARNGSDARKLGGARKMKFRGCAKIRGAKNKGAKIKEARIFKGIGIPDPGQKRKQLWNVIECF